LKWEFQVDVHEYPKDEKSYSNQTQKRIRIRELLDATFTAKEQAQAELQDIARKLKKATEEKKASEMRYKYLAGVAKTEFGVTKSNKRKVSSELRTPRGLEAFHNFRPKKQQSNDFGEEDEEEFPMKEELPENEEIMNGVKLEKSDGHRLKRPAKGLIPRHWRTPNIKHESQSESQSSIPPGHFPMKREPSEGARGSPSFQPITGRERIRHGVGAADSLGFHEGNDFKIFLAEVWRNDPCLDRISPVRTTSSTPSQGTGACHTPPSILHIPKMANESTWAGRYSNTTTAHTPQKDGHFPTNSSKPSGPEPAIPEDDGLFKFLSEAGVLGDIRSDIAAPNTKDAEISFSLAGGLDADRFDQTSSEADESEKASSDTNDSSSTTSTSPEYDPAEMQCATTIADDSDVADLGTTDVDPAALRDHKRRMDFDFLNEGSSVSSPATTDKLADSDDDEEESHMAAKDSRLLPFRMEPTQSLVVQMPAFRIFLFQMSVAQMLGVVSFLVA
jgi:hypothetical protein